MNWLRVHRVYYALTPKRIWFHFFLLRCLFCCWLARHHRNRFSRYILCVCVSISHLLWYTPSHAFLFLFFLEFTFIFGLVVSYYSIVWLWWLNHILTVSCYESIYQIIMFAVWWIGKKMMKGSFHVAVQCSVFMSISKPLQNVKINVLPSIWTRHLNPDDNRLALNLRPPKDTNGILSIKS